MDSKKFLLEHPKFIGWRNHVHTLNLWIGGFGGGNGNFGKSSFGTNFSSRLKAHQQGIKNENAY